AAIASLRAAGVDYIVLAAEAPLLPGDDGDYGDFLDSAVGEPEFAAEAVRAYRPARSDEHMLSAGLPGGSGAGKSRVSQRPVDHGAVIIDADSVAREVVAPGQPLLTSLAETFGEQILDDDGGLDRAGLAAAAFVDAEHTAKLNGLMHPAIRDRTAEHFARHADAEIVVHDVPLLVENAMTPAYHLNLLVDVPAEVRLRRLMGSRGMDRDDAAARISRQADDETRR